MRSDPVRPALAPDARRAAGRPFPLAAACLAVLVAVGTRATAVAQTPLNLPGSSYPPPSGDGASNGLGAGGAPYGVPTPSFGGMPFGVPTTDPSTSGGAPITGQAGAAEDAAADDASAGDAAAVRVALSPTMLMLAAEGGRAVSVALQSPDAPVQRVTLDLHFDADRVAVTAITMDPLLSMSGAQADFKHRLEPGRLRLSLVLTAADPSQLSTGSPNIATVTFAALTAGSAELTLNAGASSVTTADGVAHDVVLDAPVNVIVNDGPLEATAAGVIAQSDRLVAASAPASEIGGGSGSGGDVGGMARDVVNRLTAALGGLGGSDRTPLFAWLAVVAGAAVVTTLGYFLGRAPEPAGPRIARGLRGRRRGGVDIEHEVVDEIRERR
ncbi:MAG: hypothetical protein IT332_07485 [Ardenticatenales bacterium]|nr:hypothetical protein [Ardenticatenales bacterium]